MCTILAMGIMSALMIEYKKLMRMIILIIFLINSTTFFLEKILPNPCMGLSLENLGVKSLKLMLNLVCTRLAITPKNIVTSKRGKADFTKSQVKRMYNLLETGLGSSISSNI